MKFPFQDYTLISSLPAWKLLSCLISGYHWVYTIPQQRVFLGQFGSIRCTEEEERQEQWDQDLILFKPA